MMKNDHFKGKPTASLAGWYLPKCRVLTRTVAILCSLSLLLPALSFAFNAENYLLPPSQGVRLGGPGSKDLANEYRIPPHLGKVTEASFAPGNLTFVLIQDLHCHAEIQANIRTILDRLIARHPDLRLVAVEGGSGIIPTLELAQLPDTAAKRAVAEYFVKEGKLTGADWLAIIDRPEIELFGAENQTWYDQSLVLIQTFANGENRGLVMEMLDQLDFLQEQKFNPKLLGFERRRKFYQKSDADLEVYRQDLIREARQHKLELFPEPMRGLNRLTNLNYYDRVMQTQYLETEIRNQLFLTDVERKVYQYQEFVEIVERLLNVSASREDIRRYHQLAEEVTLHEIIQGLDRNLGGTTTDLAQETQTLEKALAGAFSFYRLADQRDVALFNNTLQRLKDRREHQAALITGGYHTQAITEQIRKKGYSYITIRPAMTSAGAATNYFELLRYPEQPTELERLLAGQFVKPEAMAVLNFLTQAVFRMQFEEMVLFVQMTTSEMRNKNFVKLPGLTLERIRNRLIKIKKEGGLDFMGIRFSPKGLRILGKDDVARYEARPTFMNSTQMRITGLWILSGGILAITILPLMMSLTAAAYPVLGVVLGLGLALVGLWWLSNNATGDLLQRVLTRRNIMLSFLAMGVIALPILFLPLLADVFYAGAVPASGVGAHLAALAVGVDQVMGNIPFLAGLTPVEQDPAQAAKVFQDTSSIISCSMMGVVMGSSKLVTLLTSENLRKTKTTRAKFGKEMEALRAEQAALAIKAQVSEELGERMDQEDTELWPGSFEILSDEKVVAGLHIMEVNGLPRLSDQIPLDFFTRGEPVPENLKATLVHPSTNGSDPLFRYKSQNDPVKMIHRVAVIYPQFVDEQGQPLYKELPQWYITGVLNNMNPAAVYLAYKHRLPEMLKRAGANAGAFEQLLKYMHAQWEKKSPRKDFGLLQEYISMGFLHEIVHALAVHLPDEIPEDLPEEERQNLERISVGRYMEILSNEPLLQGSSLMVKNIIKALESVEHKTPDQKIQDKINVLIALEMFCDRFSMYLYESYLKIQIYNEALQEKNGYPITVDMMLTLDEARRQEQLGDRSEVQGLTPDKLGKLEADLKAAEREHVFVSTFENPELTPAEREFFIGFHSLLKYFDSKGQILHFTRQHLNSSRFAHATISGLTRQLKMDILQRAQEKMRKWPALAALAISIVERLREGRLFHTTLDQETKQTQEQPETGEAIAAEAKTIPALPTLQFTSDMPTTKIETEFNKTRSLDIAAMDVQKPASEAEETRERKVRQALETEEPLALPQFQFGTTTVQTTEVKQPAEDIQAADAKGTGKRPAVVRPKKKKKRKIAQPDKLDARQREEISSFKGVQAVVEDADTIAKDSTRGSRLVMPSEAAPVVASENFAEGLNEDNRITPLLTGQVDAPTDSLPINFPGASVETVVNPLFNQAVLPGRPGQVAPGLMPNLNIINALNIPGTVWEQILADQRIVFLLGQAARVLNTLPDNVPMTLGFDSPELKAQLDAVLNAMPGTPQGADLAGRVQTELFPIDSRTNQRLTPQGWSPDNGMAVLTEQMSNLAPRRVVVNAHNEAAMAVPLWGIKKNKYLLKSLQSIPGWDKIVAAHNKTLGKMRNQEELSKYYLITAATIKALPQRSQERLNELITITQVPVPGFQDVSTLKVQLPTTALIAAAQPAIQKGAQRVVMDFNYYGWLALERAAATNNLGTITLGISDILMSDQAGYNMNNVFLQSLFGADTLESAPMDILVKESALEELLEGQTEIFARKLALLIDYLREILSPGVSESEIKELAETLARELHSLDTGTMIPNLKLAARLKRMHGEEWETESPQLIAMINDFGQRGRRGVPGIVPDIDPAQIKVEPTAHQNKKGLNKLASVILLGYAAGMLIRDAVVEAGRISQSKGDVRAFFGYFTTREFRQTLGLVFKIVMGLENTYKNFAPKVQRQVQDIQGLIDKKLDIEYIAPENVPESLKFDFKQLKVFNKILKKSPVFRFLMWLDKRIGDSNFYVLNDDLFMLLSATNHMQRIMWKYAPAITLEREIRRLDGIAPAMHPTLMENLARSEEEARTELEAIRANLAELAAGAATQATAGQIAELRTRQRNMRFSLKTRVSLRLLKRSNTEQSIKRNTRRLISALVQQLGRYDVDNIQNYQESVVKILSLMEPSRQAPVQIRLDSGEVIQASLPATLYTTVLRDKMMFFLYVYDTEGTPLPPVKRRILRPEAAA